MSATMRGHLCSQPGRFFVVVAIAGAAILAAGGSPTTSVPAAPDKASPAASSKPTATPKPAAEKQTLLDISGSGVKDSQTFTAAGDWDLAWTCKAPDNGVGGIMQVFIYDSSNSPVGLAANQQVGAGQTASDTTHQHQAGNFYLKVNAICDWTIKVTG